MAKADGDRVTLCGAPMTGIDGNRDTLPSLEKTTMFILGGRGRGQYRHIASFDGREMRIESPFAVTPDSTSIVSVGSFNRRHLIIGNHMEDAGTVVQLYPPNFELLVAIGIISILASLLLPALQNAKSEAVSLTCLSNMRQSGLAFQHYAGDNDDVPPVAQPNDDAAIGRLVYAAQWPDLLMINKYLPDVRKTTHHIYGGEYKESAVHTTNVFSCPSLPPPDSYSAAGFNYPYNDWKASSILCFGLRSIHASRFYPGERVGVRLPKMSYLNNLYPYMADSVVIQTAMPTRRFARKYCFRPALTGIQRRSSTPITDNMSSSIRSKK